MSLQKDFFNQDSNPISKYVSNLDKDIYSISALPEEVIATLFAYVSRSPKSFRENLLSVSQQKAKEFHEKWVLNYGHASVAELAVTHIGIEKVSRLFSSLLERSNPYISPVEYSQRYQKPKRGDFYIPSTLDNLSLKIYCEYQSHIYDVYLSLFNKLVTYLKANINIKKTQSSKNYNNYIDKLAFEDARYILPLAVYTNLGLTTNARACADMICMLLSSEYPEVRDRALEIKTEVLRTLPTLIKYVDSKNFITSSRNVLRNFVYNNTTQSKNINKPLNNIRVELVDFSFKNTKDPQEAALNSLIAKLTFPFLKNNLSFNDFSTDIESKPLEQKIKLFNNIMASLEDHDNPLPPFEDIVYHFKLHMSEACWHQFLRHRKINISCQYPSIEYGYIIPQNIIEANLKDSFTKAILHSKDIYNKIASLYPFEAHYLVTNSHIRPVLASLSLWEIYHLINLRLSKNAQWEIRNLVSLMACEIQHVQPALIKPALDRSLNRRN